MDSPKCTRGHVKWNFFLHPVRSMGYIVHSGASVVRNFDALFLCLDGTGTDSTKERWDTLHQTFVFASGVICRSHSAFWCFRGVKRRRTIFYATVGQVRIP
jgi:hypothetical protein